MAGMLDCRKPNYWAICRLRLLVFHHCTRYFDRRPNYGPKSKFEMDAVRHPGFSKTWPMGLIKQLLFHLRTKYSAKMLTKRRPNYGRPPSWKFWKFDFLDCWFSITVPNLVQKCWLAPKSWPKMANSRWRPSAILDFWKFDFWPMGVLRQLIFHHSTKYGATILIDGQIMAQNRNSRWRPSAILEFLYHHIGPPTKFFRWATSICQILY